MHMINYKKMPLLLLLGCVVTAVAAMTALRAQDQTSNKEQPSSQEKQRIAFERQFPVIDYASPGPSEAEKRAQRRVKSKKYDGAAMPIDERADTVFSTLDWAAGLPALPVDRSQAIILGEVTDAQAYLSDDKTAVYSEFTVSIEDVLKNDNSVPLYVTGKVVVERSGGRVRFPSGHTVLQFTNGQGMPLVGHRYVFFLTHDFPLLGHQEQDFYLLTGYEFKGTHVALLDNPGGGTHPMTRHNGADVAAFLKNLQATIARASSVPQNQDR
jgi:hypothetical protein